jgi:hypothetical protein
MFMKYLGVDADRAGLFLRMKQNFSIYLGLVFAALLIWPAAAGAQARDVFSVSSVPVDARAANELAAKSSGIARGQHDALRILFERLTLKDDHDRLPALDERGLTALLRDFSVDREKFGGGRYIASLTVRFKAEGVRQILGDAEIPFAETPSRPVLVLPVFQTAGSTVLWDGTNPWFAAWLRLGRIDGLLPLLLPVGDLSDISALSAEGAVLGERRELSEISLRYGSGEVMVVVASLAIDQTDGKMRVEIATSRYGGNSNDQTVFRRFEAKAESSRDALLFDAAVTLSGEAVEGWKRDNLLERSVEQRVSVIVPFGGLGEWLSIRKRLETIAALKAINVLSLSIERAEIAISYLGNADQLRLAMAQSNLELLYAAKTATWTLRSKASR